MEFATFYVGSGLAPHLQACLRSWVDFGHSIDCYSYDPAVVLPPGVVRKDASEILPSSEVYAYRTGLGKGSVSAFSNEFRYRLCQSRNVVWVDTDVLCLRPDWPSRPYHFAWQSPERLECNVAVLGAPPDSELLVAALKNVAKIDRDTAHFGQLGPVPFTETIRANNLEHLVAESWEFYPISYADCRYFLDPNLLDEADQLMERSYAVHLWNEIWTRSRFPTYLRPPRGSFLERVYQRHGVTIPIEVELEDVEILTFVDPMLVVSKASFDELSEWASSMEQELIGVKTWANSLNQELRRFGEQFTADPPPTWRKRIFSVFRPK